jgi:hypothetical protein
MHSELRYPGIRAGHANYWCVWSLALHLFCSGSAVGAATECPPYAGPAVVLIDLNIENQQWNNLRSLVVSFAKIHGLSLQDSSEERSVVKILNFTLCSEDDFTAHVVEQRWKSADFSNAMKGWGVLVRVFSSRNPDTQWKPLVIDLLARFEAAWPGRVRFRDGDGALVARPAELETIP